MLTLGSHAWLPTLIGTSLLLYAVLALWAASPRTRQTYFGTFFAAATFCLFLSFHYQTSVITARMVRLEAQLTNRAQLFRDQFRDANAGETLEGRISGDVEALGDLLREALARRDGT
jgi:hypothetical protein